MHKYFRLIRSATVVVLLSGLAAGCQNMNPLNKQDYLIEIASREKTQNIDELEIESLSASDPVSVEDATAEMIENWKPQTKNEGESLELALAEVRAAALANNLDLRVALYDPSISQESINEEEARFEWTFTTSARRTRTDTPTASQLTSAKSTNSNVDLGVRIPLRTGGTVNINLPMNRSETNNRFSTLNPAFTSDLTFSISQPLLRNAGIRANTHGIRVAKYQKQITDARTKLEAIRILANADRVYWNLYAAREELKVRQLQYELAIAQLERSQRFYDAESGTRLDVMRAESGVAQRLEAIVIAENNMRQRERDLKRIMNRDDLPISSTTALISVTEPNPVGLDLDSSELAAFAIENRMEMLEEEIRLAIAASTIDIERNRALPLVTLDYRYNINGLGGTLGNAFDMLAQKSFEDYSVGLNVEIPLGNEAAIARVNRSIIERVQRLATKELRTLAIEQEVYNAVDQLDTNWQRVLAARQSSILAGEVFQGEQRFYDGGHERTSTDVLNAATDLAEAQSAEIRALVDYQIAQVDLSFATGTLLGRDQIRWEALTADDLD